MEITVVESGSIVDLTSYCSVLLRVLLASNSIMCYAARFKTEWGQTKGRSDPGPIPR